MNKPGLHIGAHVFTPDGPGYIRTSPSGDMYAVHLDNGEVVSHFSSSIRPETFKEFLVKRPGNVGAWSRFEFLGVQLALLCLLGASIATFMEMGWIGLLIWAVIQGTIYYGMRRNWKGKQA